MKINNYLSQVIILFADVKINLCCTTSHQNFAIKFSYDFFISLFPLTHEALLPNSTIRVATYIAKSTLNALFFVSLIVHLL